MKLNEITTKITKGTTPTTLGMAFSSSGINFIKSESIVSGRDLDHTKFAYINEATHNKLQRSQLQENDILFSMAGVYLGKTAIVKKSDIPANTNQAVAIIRVDAQKAVYEYIYYLLNSKALKEFINGSVAQSAQPNFNLKQIGDIEIHLPPLAEQRAIADTLSALDAKIANNTKINHHLASLRSATDNSPDIRRGRSVLRIAARQRFSSFPFEICRNTSRSVLFKSSPSNGIKMAKSARSDGLIDGYVDTLCSAIACSRSITDSELSNRYKYSFDTEMSTL